MIFPLTKFEIEVNGNSESIFEKLSSTISSENKFDIETIFGQNKAVYIGCVDHSSIIFHRKIESIFFGIPIYPSNNITVKKDGDKVLILNELSLSGAWKFFLSVIYFLSILMFVLGMFKIIDVGSIHILIIKMILLVAILNILVFYYHFSELKNIKFIMSKIVQNM